MPTKTILSPAQRAAIFDRLSIVRPSNGSTRSVPTIWRRWRDVGAGLIGSAMRCSCATYAIPGVGC
jgi:hypothetical protein